MVRVEGRNAGCDGEEWRPPPPALGQGIHIIHSFAQQQRPNPLLIILQLFRSRSMVKVAKEFNIRCISFKFLSFVPVMEVGTNAQRKRIFSQVLAICCKAYCFL